MMHDTLAAALVTQRSALFLDGWLRFNEEMWGYKAEKVFYELPGKDLPKLEAVFYLNKQGHVVLPPRNPYLPLRFFPTPTEQLCRLSAQWSQVAELLVGDLLKRGFRGTIAFPPGFIDGRVFQWNGLNVGLKYTFATSLPVDIKTSDTSVRNKIKKAKREGYNVKVTQNWDDVYYCLSKTEETKNFSHMTSPEDLFLCSHYLGKESVRGYVCYTQEGEPVSGQIKLFLADGVSIDWSAGTDRQHIKSGVNQLTYAESFKDMAEHGGKLFDFVGANIEAVANAKAAWGFPLMPYLTLTHDSVARKMYRVIVPKSMKPAIRTFFKGF